VLVVGAGVVYLFGFIVVSIFDASYGIADFNLFRTKVVAVGSLFVFLLAVPMVVTFRMFSFFGLTVEHVNPSPIEVLPKNRLFVVADIALSIPFACVGLTVLMGFLSPKFSLSEWKGWGFGLFIFVAALTAAQAISAKKWFNAHPFLFVFLSSLNTAALFFIVFRYADRSYFWLVLWLSLVCLFTLHTSLKLQTPEALRKTEWERLFLVIVPAIFVLYATKLYPNIKHQFGGGAPVPIILHMTKKMPVFDSETVPVSLVDETEQGYYVLRGSDKAVFVARSLVEEVEFLRDTPVNDTNAKKP